MQKDQSFFKPYFHFIPPLLSVILMMLASGFFTTFVSLYLNGHGVAKENIGLIQSAFYLGMLLGAFRMESLIRRVGHIQALAVFASLASGTVILQLISQNLIVWGAMRFLNGMSLAAIYIVIESWMLDYSTVKTRGVILSLYMICLYLSQAISQQFLTFFDIEGIYPYLLCALLTSLGVIPVGLSTNRIELLKTEEAIKFKRIVKSSPLGVTACLASGLILSAIYSFLPIYAVARNISSQNLMSVMIAGGVLLQWPLGKLSDYFDRRKTLMLIIFVALALSLTIFFYQSSMHWFYYLFAFLIGGFGFTLYPVSVTQVCDNLEHNHITKATALMLIVYGLGSVGGPIASATAIAFFGINSLFFYLAFILAITALIGLYVMMRKPMVPSEEQHDFVPLPRVTPVAYEMDPRSEENDPK